MRYCMAYRLLRVQYLQLFIATSFKANLSVTFWYFCITTYLPGIPGPGHLTVQVWLDCILSGILPHSPVALRSMDSVWPKIGLEVETWIAICCANSAEMEWKTNNFDIFRWKKKPLVESLLTKFSKYSWKEYFVFWVKFYCCYACNWWLRRHSMK